MHRLQPVAVLAAVVVLVAAASCRGGVSDQGFIQGDLWGGIADYWETAGLDVTVITTSARALVGLWEQGGHPPDTATPARLPVQAIGFTHVNDPPGSFLQPDLPHL